MGDYVSDGWGHETAVPVSAAVEAAMTAWMERELPALYARVAFVLPDVAHLLVDETPEWRFDYDGTPSRILRPAGSEPWSAEEVGAVVVRDGRLVYAHGDRDERSRARSVIASVVPASPMPSRHKAYR